MSSHRVELPYRVDLPLYSGPMDLLLYLVRRQELSTAELPLAEVTTQYAGYLSLLQFIDFDEVGEFLVVASTLAELKSREALPQPEESHSDPAPDEAPTHDLVSRLLEYKRYRDAATALEQQAETWLQRFPRLSDERPVEGRDHAADLIREVELWDLVSALGRVLQKKILDTSATIRDEEIPLAVVVEQISQRVRAEGRVEFSRFFEGANHKSRVVGVFLAILELLRHHHFRAEQTQLHGEIWILPPAEGASSENPGEPQTVSA